jgi:dUTP pyrophosphatase
MTELLFRKLHDQAHELTRGFEDDAGLDLRAYKFHRVEPGKTVQIPTGISIQLKPYHAALVLPRSGLAAKHSITIQNSPGLIDPGYRGEIVVLLRNEGEIPYSVKAGDKIAQLLIVGLPHVQVTEVAELATSARGVGGFGSTGR